VRHIFAFTCLCGALLHASSLCSTLRLTFLAAESTSVGSGRTLGAGTRIRALRRVRGRRKREGNDLQARPGSFCLGPGPRGWAIVGRRISKGAAWLPARGDGENVLCRVATIDKRTNASHVLVGTRGANHAEIAAATVAEVENQRRHTLWSRQEWRHSAPRVHHTAACACTPNIRAPQRWVHQCL